MGKWGEIGAFERAGRQEGIMTGAIAKDKEVHVFPFRTRALPLMLPPFNHKPHPVLCQLRPPGVLV